MEIERKFLVKDLNKVKEIIKLAKKGDYPRLFIYWWLYSCKKEKNCWRKNSKI